MVSETGLCQTMKQLDVQQVFRLNKPALVMLNSRVTAGYESPRSWRPATNQPPAAPACPPLRTGLAVDLCLRGRFVEATVSSKRAETLSVYFSRTCWGCPRGHGWSELWQEHVTENRKPNECIGHAVIVPSMTYTLPQLYSCIQRSCTAVTPSRGRTYVRNQHSYKADSVWVGNPPLFDVRRTLRH